MSLIAKLQPNGLLNLSASDHTHWHTWRCKTATDQSKARNKHLPRKMWRKRQSMPCRSFATSSCVGGDWVMSCQIDQVSKCHKPKKTSPIHMIRCRIDTYQGREALVSVAAQHGETTMRAGVGCRQGLAEGPYCRPRRRGACRRGRLVHCRLILLRNYRERREISTSSGRRRKSPKFEPNEIHGRAYLRLRHEHDLRVDLVGVRLRLAKSHRQIS